MNEIRYIIRTYIGLYAYLCYTGIYQIKGGSEYGQKYRNQKALRRKADPDD